MPDLTYPHEIINGTLPDADEVQENFDAIKSLIENLGVDNFASALQAKLVPPGAMHDYAGPTAPSGYLLCDGSVVSRTTYADLFAAIGTTYNTGGEAGTDFRLPDFRGRVAMAPDGSAGRITTASDTLGATGGAERVTLAATESGLPAHNPVITDPGHNHDLEFESGGTDIIGTANFDPPVGAGVAYALRTDNVGDGNIKVEPSLTGITSSVAAAAAAASHQNLPPFQVANKIIKT